MHKIKPKNILAKFLFTLLTLHLFVSNAYASPTRTLTVFAEENMSSALIKLARVYSQKNRVIVSVNFNSSAELMNDIDSGEPADIFISAHSGWLESLKQKGLTDIYNTGHIARDRLVLVAANSNTQIPTELKNKKITLENALKIVNQNKFTLLTDQEATSSGKFSNDLVRSLALDELHLFTKLSEDKSSGFKLTGDNALSYALLLNSQVVNRKNLQILATQKQAAISYQALVIAGDNMETAREFLKFLKSDTAKTILHDNGFIID